MSIAIAVMWISNFLVSQTFPVLDRNSFLLEKFNHGFAYWIYGGIAIIALLFTWKMIPETKGKTLEEIEEIWNTKT
jgi:SP family xylose:H+ symportor-like MFS transporter